MKKTIGIIFGGKSVEHDVSIITALQIYSAIDKYKYIVEMFYITKENKIIVGKGLEQLETYKNKDFKKTNEIYFYSKDNKTYYHSKNKKGKVIDVMINAVHGKGVEDGTISAILDFNNIAYTSSQVTESAIIQDKWLTKLILEHYKIPTLPSQQINKKEKIKIKIALPIIIKPVSLGSSIGITIVKNEDEMVEKLNESFNYQERLMIEPLLEQYREFSCAIYEINQLPVHSAIEETINEHDIYTFNDKYASKEQRRVIPALISDDLAKQIRKVTQNVYRIFNLKGVVRVDFLFDTKNNQLYVNEINSIPGSFSYLLFEKEGINFKKLLDDLIIEALLEKSRKNKYISNYDSKIINQQEKIRITK